MWGRTDDDGRARTPSRLDVLVLYDGRVMPAREACRLSGVGTCNYTMRRYKLGWPPERWFDQSGPRPKGTRPGAGSGHAPGGPAGTLARTKTLGAYTKGRPIVRTLAVPLCVCGAGSAPPRCASCSGAVPTEDERPHLAALLRLNPAALGGVITSIRTLRRMSRHSLAQGADLGRNCVADLEAGKVPAVPIGHIHAIAQALRVPLDRLLEAGAAPAVTSPEAGPPRPAAAAPGPASSAPRRCPDPPPAARRAYGTPAPAR